MDGSRQLDTKIIIVLILILGFITNIYTKFEFTNMECIATDKEYGKFDYCYLKSKNRTYKYASMKYSTSEILPKNLLIALTVEKRLNGYKPFLYNISVDFCRYIRNPNPGNKVANFFYSLIKPYTNINHSCAYTGDIIVDKVPISFLSYKLTELLHFPDGDYRITTYMIIKDIKRTKIMIYFKLF
ncbi:uncharacterized protein LOC117567230 [Drosophila albomicans]|uniref:Uncharacterized protein LOC117567230 n=1 Tax=Drosophila albomicans TaxID=7291 RepID=A0A6P8WGZ9_DROAB|nr:uncharacterized protein LOC117567230 [Drosophila albomicans]